MANKKERRELTQSCKNLLEFAAGDLIPMLEKKKDLLYVKQQAFDYYSGITKEHYQVQVTVTRDKDDFLEFLQVEEMRLHGG